MNNTFEEIAKVIENGEVFLIFPHIVVDGDALGSSTAICEALRLKGKKAYVVLEDDIAKNLKFLDDCYCINVNEVDFAHDTSICVDCSEKSRFPNRVELFDKAKTTICIDHHKTADPFCQYFYVDPNSAATAELAYLLIKAMGVEITTKIAKRIYTGIITDTGNFQYSNTTKRTHQIVSELYDVCDGFNDISVAIYENDSFERLALQSEILSNAEIFAGGKGIVAYVTQDMLKKCNAIMDDSEGTVSRLRAISGVEISVLVKEKEDGKIKVSMRAKTYGDVASICVKYGGGGHTKAAGFTSDKPLREVIEIIKKDVEQSFE